MTKTRFIELQTEIARLKEIDKQTSDGVRATYSLSDWADDKKSFDTDGGMPFEAAHTNHDIVVPCSKELDEEWYNESI